MSKKYLEEFGKKKIGKNLMRNFCQRPGKVDENGNIQYTTEQHHKLECDINNIIKKYDRTGLITHVSKIEAKYGDLTGMDFKIMRDQVANATSMFEALPAEIRKEFDNDPAKLITFMEHPGNRERAIKLGLIDGEWTEETDGLGEHVPKGGNVKKTNSTPPDGGSEE